MNKKIILASQSPRRKELLQGLGLSFIVISSSVDEEEAVLTLNPQSPEALVRMLSDIKVQDVAKHQHEGIIIGADTIVVLGNQILGKPKDEADARNMLKQLSGNTHLVISGVTIMDVVSQQKETFHVNTEVDFKTISESELAGYLRIANYMDKAGSYAVQEHGALFVTGIRGCFYNVVGLPIYQTGQTLKKFGIDILGNPELV
ncbi:septum formation protein Maf [Desulfuribacillus stibiiarsenatis]|uniref:dTTP/UTP pyrophosphatase n=1 Tax=Desulfuribacillus stibiiarsenatis TaxID=1390249 RepID=A0A1E5L2F5_9FIRM|nr:Maf family protein [Desulfuribacillus stibiiarsenatis]OEH84231.1 septum formation protein Maf [Desulfuribacillus stibiiarsenatis]